MNRKLNQTEEINITRRYGIKALGYAAVAVASTGIIPNLDKYVLSEANAASSAKFKLRFGTIIAPKADRYLASGMYHLAKAIQEKRLWLDEQGKLRFKKQACRRMFTRSMSFPVNMRNGSIDHIPSTIGKGVGELPAPTIEQGLYYKIDKQDRETNEVYEIKKRQI